MTELSFSIPDWAIVAVLSLGAINAIGKLVLWLQDRKLGKLRRESDARLIKNLNFENQLLENQVTRQRETIEELRGD